MNVRQALRGHERLLLGVAAATVTVAALEAGTLALLVPLLEAFRSRAADTVARLAAAVVALFLARTAVAYAGEVLAVRLHLGVLLGLRERLAQSFYQSRYAELAALGAGRLVNVFSVQTERVVSALSAMLSVAQAGVLLAVYAVALIALSWRLSLVAVAVVAAGAAIATFARQRILRYSARMVSAEEESSALAADDAAGLHVIHAYDAGRERLALHRAANADIFRETMGLHRWRAAVRPLTEFLYAAVLLAGLLVALALTPGRLFESAPALLAFAVVLHRAQGQLGSVLDAFSTLAEQEGASVNVFALLDRAPRAAPALPSPRDVGRVEVDGLTVAYVPGSPVLHDLDLVLARGEVTAVVGESGAGKSTLVHVLAGLRSADAGRITVDGVPLEHLAAGRPAGIGVVFEDGFLFDQSVEWNVSLGRDLPAGAVRRAGETTELAGMLGAWPEGYATRTGPRGVRLSAGQRQRVALARALAASPEILMLDEATSALDTPSESRIAERMRALRPRGITLLVAHRLSTVLAADRILVLDGGRIVAAGQHEQLLQTSPVYRRLVESQLVGSETGSGAGNAD